jgi:hypothetical protein
VEESERQGGEGQIMPLTIVKTEPISDQPLKIVSTAPIATPPPPSTLSQVGDSVGSHLKNLIAGPYHAFADAPRNQMEQQEKGSTSADGTVKNVLGQIGLGAARMFVNPTVDALKEASDLHRQGGPQSSLTASSTYDDKGNNIPTAGSKLIDAIPVLGPWSRSFTDEVHQKGTIPALAGLATDVAVPAGVSKIMGAIRGAAPSMAEGAMGIRRGDRGFGKTPGRAILDETSGVRPETVGKQAKSVLGTLNPQIDSMAAAHSGILDTTPAIQHIQDAIDTAATRNNAGGMTALNPVKGALTTNATTGLPLSSSQTATGVLNLKRGLRDQFVKNWSPDAASILTRDTAKGASGVLDDTLDSALGPDFTSTNQRISSLIPVKDAAEKLSRADELPQKFGDKLKAHTGALTSAVAGGYGGAHEFGVLGGVGGALGGFLLPELISSPTARLVMARGMNSRLPGVIAPPLASGGIVTPVKRKRKAE